MKTGFALVVLEAAERMRLRWRWKPAVSRHDLTFRSPEPPPSWGSNSIVAAGLGRYGLREEAARILGGLFDASLHFDLHRLPELFCGFTRHAGESPTLYPQACSPQAWAAAAPLLCLQACLGLEVHGAQGMVCLRNPVMPRFLDQIRIHGLRLPRGRMDIVVTRHEGDVGVRLMRREGQAELVVSM